MLRLDHHHHLGYRSPSSAESLQTDLSDPIQSTATEQRPWPGWARLIGQSCAYLDRAEHGRQRKHDGAGRHVGTTDAMALAVDPLPRVM